LAHQDKALLLMQSLFYDTHFCSPKFAQRWGKERFAGHSAMLGPEPLLFTHLSAILNSPKIAAFSQVEARFNPRHCL
jgi:hypothetical protein